MAVVTSFSPDSNFWELNPQLLLDPALKAYHKADKSKDKDSSSKALWWVALCYDLDPDNKWRGGILEEKQVMLAEELGLGKDFYRKAKKELDIIIAAYLRFTDSPAKRQLRMLEQKMEEKTAFMSKTKYGEDTYDILDKMMVSDDKLYALLAKVTKQLSEETGEGQGKGGSAASLSDGGEI
jgi:hypothetical protein